MAEKRLRKILSLLFPKFCLGCEKEGAYLCLDCLATLEIFKTHQPCKTGSLTDLYFAVSYDQPLVKKLIISLKYKPFVKELSKDLASIIIKHFQIMVRSII